MFFLTMFVIPSLIYAVEDLDGVQRATQRDTAKHDVPLGKDTQQLVAVDNEHGRGFPFLHDEGAFADGIVGSDGGEGAIAQNLMNRAVRHGVSFQWGAEKQMNPSRRASRSGMPRQ